MGHAAADSRAPGHGLGMTAVYTHTRPETVREQLNAALAERPALATAREWLSRDNPLLAIPVYMTAMAFRP